MALLTSWFLYDFVVLVAAIIALTYAYFRYSFGHWRRRGIPAPVPPSFPFGNFSGMSRTSSLDIILADLYHKTNDHPLIGFYFMAKPTILLRDLDLIKTILIKDFSNFQDRGIEIDSDRDPLSDHLFLINGQKWRNLRVTLTPTFTSGKMKMMFPTLIDVGRQLQSIIKDETSQTESDIKDLMARYTIDVISSVAFGIESNSLKNPNVEFRTITQEFAKPTLRQIVLNFLLLSSSNLANLLRIKLTPQHIEDFFVGLVKDTMEYREKNNVKRNDFLQLLLQLRNTGHVKDADHADLPEDQKQKFSVEQAAAQAFLFFVAGFETSSSTMQYALYELALNPDLQKQVQEEIKSVKEKYGGEITYDSLMEMDLLDRTVSETLRKYPVAGVLLRVCSKEYVIPGTNYTLLPKDSVQISVYGIHHDPELYPNPEKFDPERFLPEVKASRHPCAYLPFGDGPRSCIGNRFALMQTKTGLAVLLDQFSVGPSKRTPIPLQFDPNAGVSRPKDPIFLKFTQLK